jgi:hypothetical protein
MLILGRNLGEVHMPVHAIPPCPLSKPIIILGRNSLFGEGEEF